MLQHILDALKRLLLATKRQEGLPFDIEQILLAHGLRAGEVAAAEHPGHFFGYEDVVFRGIVAKFERMRSYLKRAQAGAAQHVDILALNGHDIVCCQLKHFLFSFADVAGRIVHHHIFLGQQVAIIERFVR